MLPAVTLRPSWASPRLSPGVHWTKTPPNLCGAGGDPNWGPRLWERWGEGAWASSEHQQQGRCQHSTLQRPPANGIGQTPSASAVCRRGRETGEHSLNCHKTGMAGPGLREGEGLRPTLVSSPQPGNPKKPRSVCMSLEWGRGGSGAQAETGKECRLRGPWALPALPCFSSSFPYSLVPLSVHVPSSCVAHPLPHSWLTPVLHPGPQLGRPGLAGPPSQALRPVRGWLRLPSCFYSHSLSWRDWPTHLV